MSILKVAEEAGVSPATVSRFINNRVSVSPEKARRIHKAMLKLNYTPSVSRPGPKTADRRAIKTGNITFLSLSDLDPTAMFRMPVFPSLLGGIQQALSEYGLNLALEHYTGSMPRTISRNRTDGVLIFGALQPMPKNLHEALLKVPSVWVMRAHSDNRNEFDHVFYDNDAVGPLAARYLLERGHRRLAFINPQITHTAFPARRDAFAQTVQQSGAQVTVWEITEEETNRSAAQGIERIVQDMASSPQRPTGIFVPADDYLLSVFHALRVFGLIPQRDVELIGCNNDQPSLAKMHPRPATIDLNVNVVGRRAVEQLLSRMADPDDPLARIKLQPTLIEGEALSAEVIFEFGNATSP
ncbi:MAG TPA: LacI family DNA-binding transcriptional regulator [Blastocatellia bacterium]|jgi:DNA-binding LacI/PurR family transcriptional regulator|nr:LacI family DNA-binding transcriptional regulator [Blastocatellia bacterium]